MNDLNDMFAEAERIAREEADRYDAHIAKPEVAAKLAAQRKVEFDHGVREGWWDAEGNPLPQPEDDDTDEEEEDEE